MGLKAGIVGLPNVGKSTLFNAITNSDLVELDGTSFGQLIYEDNNSHNPESLLTHYAYKIRLLLSYVKKIKSEPPCNGNFCEWFIRMYANSVPRECFSQLQKTLLERRGL